VIEYGAKLGLHSGERPLKDDDIDHIALGITVDAALLRRI
jgi:hypothetical protein